MLGPRKELIWFSSNGPCGTKLKNFIFLGASLTSLSIIKTLTLSRGLVRLSRLVI